MENISILRSELENKKDPIDIIKDHLDGKWNYGIISKNFFFVYIRLLYVYVVVQFYP